MKCLVYLWVALALILTVACSAQDSSEGNRLINAQSPYLQQHAFNPVDWYPWGEEAFEKAQAEQKLILISIGYAACHWCHVMEDESFEDTTVAEVMNQYFVSIKVDREERPDVDDIYMTACQLISRQNCGWPLNIIALPDQRPIFAGTYFPKEQWINILQRVQDIYASSPTKAEDLAQRVTDKIEQLQAVTPVRFASSISSEELALAVDTLLSQMDMVKGGRKGAPKFPMPVNLNFLMEYAYFTKNEQALNAVTITLDNMMKGGIYDHLGGGFSRYATDEDWLIPHFEKMLYDNGQLISVYSDAYRMTGNEMYEQVVRESLLFIEQELMSDEGGFYSSLDADSEGEEGKYYVWKKEELDVLLGKDSQWFCEFFNVTEEGNWESKNILFKDQSLSAFAKDRGEDPIQMKERLAEAQETLLEERARREKPRLDDKQITSWNALMMKGYIDAFKAFGDSTYLSTALRNARFLKAQCWAKNGQLFRIYKDGTSTVPGFMDDYAFLAQAFIELYQVTFDEQWLEDAEQLVKYAMTHFFDESTGTFFYTSNEGEHLLTRTREMADDVIPGSNSVMSHVLFSLGNYFYKEEWIDLSKQMLGQMNELLVEGPGFYANWGSLSLKMIYPPLEVAILGEHAESYRSQMARAYHPNVLFLGGTSEGDLALLENKLIKGQTTIYVCQNKTCKLPVTTVEDGLNLIQQSQ